ncbi:MAG: hypothetical protein QM504_10935 [Pseudomonadota bacterium]
MVLKTFETAQIKEYFEMVGRITIQFSVVEMQGMELLAVLINNSYRETGYFIADEYDRKSAQKFSLIKKIIKEEAHLGYIEDEIKADFIETLNKLDVLRIKRNEIIHSVIIFDKKDDDQIFSKTLKFNRKKKILEKTKQTTINDLSDLHWELIAIESNLSEFYKHLTLNVL